MESGAGSVEMGQVLEAVVRNAMEKLVQKRQTLHDQPAHTRKRDLARYFEETRRQLTSVLALLRWQQQRLKVTAKCEDLIESLERHRSHMAGTAERMCIAAEETRHHYRTPMYDMRTAVDVLAAGTYRGLPSMNMDHVISSRVSEGEKGQVFAQLDFMLRSELLRMRIPPELSRVEVRNGRLLLESADEFELDLSLRLELPNRPFRVDRLQLLVKAKGGTLPPCQQLADFVEKRMANEAQEPLNEAVRILADAARLRAWHILHEQAKPLLLFPKVDVEATTSLFVIHYWQDSPMLSFEPLMTAAVRASTASIKPESLDHLGGSSSSTLMSQVKGGAPRLILMSNRDMQSRMQIKHLPALVKESGQALDIAIKRSELDLAEILDQTLKQHANCRLRLLHRSLVAPDAALLGKAGMSPHLSQSGHELVIKLDGVPRLSIVVDHRSGELEARDLEAACLSIAAHDKLQTGLHQALFKGLEGAATQALLKWRANDMLRMVSEMAPALGLRPAPRLLTYSHSQATQLQAILGDDKPAIFLQMAGSGMLDSGYRDVTKPVPKPSAQDIWTLVVECDATKRRYEYRLVILSVSKAGKTAKQPQVHLIDPGEDGGAGGLGGTAGPAARDSMGCAIAKRPKVSAGDRAGMKRAAAAELSRVVELVAQRVNLMKLQRQLDSHGLSWRAADGVMLLTLPCWPLQCRELRLTLDPRNASMLAGGQAGWSLEMHLTSSMLPDAPRPCDLVPAPRGKGFIEDILHVALDPKAGSLCADVLIFSFPYVYAESIRDMRTALQGVVMLARLAQEAHGLLGADADKMPPGATALRREVKMEAVGYTAVVMRLVHTDELITVRCRTNGGLVVAIGQGHRHPMASHVEVALEAGKPLAAVLLSLVTAAPLLSSVKTIQAGPGDITVLAYSLQAVAIVFRACFALYVRWTADASCETPCYSVSDLCPHSNHRPLPAGIDNTFMSHAQHTGGSVSSLADTLWCIPCWSGVVSAAAHSFSQSGNGHADGNAAVQSGGGVVQQEAGGGATSSVFSHVDERRSALVCGAQHLPQLLATLHAHMAAWHLYHMGANAMAKARPMAAAAGVAAGAAGAAGVAAVAPVQSKEGSLVSGRYVFTLEMAAPATGALASRQADAAGVQRLCLKIDMNASAARPGEEASATLEQAHLHLLKRVLQEQVMAPPYAPNRMRSFVRLLSFPPATLGSICLLMQQLPVAFPGLAQVALAPALVLQATRSSAGKDAGRSASMADCKAPAVTARPVEVPPRSEASCSFSHDAAAEEAGFCVRLFAQGCDAPAVEMEVKDSPVRLAPRASGMLLLSGWCTRLHSSARACRYALSCLRQRGALVLTFGCRKRPCACVRACVRVQLVYGYGQHKLWATCVRQLSKEVVCMRVCCLWHKACGHVGVASKGGRCKFDAFQAPALTRNGHLLTGAAG